jgi:tRNA (guanine26-N2/guanine27-N2)-dimethyltransferase
MIVKEGKAEIVVEDGVFYNPRMKFCRNMDMLVFSRISKDEEVVYLDALAATGIRGIRAALEAEYTVFFNDKNRKAVELIKKNLQHNGIEAEVFNRDASALMREHHFKHVDIDPFGSPSEFIDAACFSSTKYLSVTATDTAALCGSASTSGLRKYSAYAEKTEYYPEIGLRMLAGKIAREATKYDKGIEVLVSWAKEHYYRIHIRFRRSPSYAGKMYSKLGYLYHCWKCGRREWISMKGECKSNCQCGSCYTMMGPLWLGELHNRGFVAGIIKAGDERSKEIDLLRRINEELEIPFHYDLHHISKAINASPPSMDALIEEMQKHGYAISRTRYSGTSFKTDASIDETKEIIQRISPSST